MSWTVSKVYQSHKGAIKQQLYCVQCTIAKLNITNTNGNIYFIRPKILNLQDSWKPVCLHFFQASSGREMDQNKGVPAIL